jgi:molybdopterin molybdotransferase
LNKICSVSGSIDKLLAVFHPLPEEQVDLANAFQRVLADDIHAGFDVPSFNNSSMDGFAVRAQDTVGVTQSSPVELQVVADIPAGQFPSFPITAGQTMRIMTGAPVPEGADAIVPIENTDFYKPNPDDTVPLKVQINRSARPGDFVRFQSGYSSRRNRFSCEESITGAGHWAAGNAWHTARAGLPPAKGGIDLDRG